MDKTSYNLPIPSRFQDETNCKYFKDRPGARGKNSGCLADLRYEMGEKYQRAHQKGILKDEYADKTKVCWGVHRRLIGCLCPFYKKYS